MTAPDDVFSFVEENGRTYHSYKAPSKSHVVRVIPLPDGR